ncbi:MAG TPA: substrate-binding domain-containing protein [Nostocaceae cyanobacterium]|nr:substrate-binding domain-containing protein [Nostocaceae cyanobacterium]
MVKDAGKKVAQDAGKKVADSAGQKALQDAGKQAADQAAKQAVTPPSKSILEEAMEREAVAQRLKTEARAQTRLPGQLRWIERFYWVFGYIQAAAAPTTEKVKARVNKFFKKEQDVEVVTPEEAPVKTTEKLGIYLGVDPVYRKYRCPSENIIGCEWAQATLEENAQAKYCSKCEFPVILPPKAEFRGYRGRYRIEEWLGHRGMGRIYLGSRVTDQQPIVVKEYLLPQAAFNPEETRDRKQAFERLAGLNLADGRIQDIRLNAPWDAIADPVEERCYLVTTGNQDAYPTLSTYLEQKGAMTEREIRRFLDQVLQTLQFIHTQKFSLPSGQVLQGIPHGNLNLNSLLILEDNRGFFIHVSDLALWERVFDLPTTKPTIPTPAQDLVDLGNLAFILLSNKIASANNLPLNPRQNEGWQPVSRELREFIERLLEIGTPFASAEEARQALLKLPPLPPTIDLVEITGEAEQDKAKLRRPPLLLLGIFGLLLLIALVWYILQQWQKQSNLSEDATVCCLEDVAAVPPGNYFYASEKNGTWNYIQTQTNLILKNQTLEEKLRESQPKLNLFYQPADSFGTAITRMKAGEIQFAITNLVNRPTAELQYQEVAYDGIVVFIAFSYSKRDKSLPKALNGQITFEQIRDLYTGKITNWRQIDPNLPKLPVRLYMPPDQETAEIFEQRVLKDANAIATFKSLQNNEQPNNLFTQNSSQNSAIKINRLDTTKMLQQVLRDFEVDDIGSIGFSTVSKVFGQCSAYPLAVIDGEKPAVQPLIQDNGNPVSPSTDLCDDKGSYRPNIEVFKTGSYPLSYPIVVIYQGDNSRPPIGLKFADMLRTEEVQRLLEKAGLVPIQRPQR